MDDHSAQEMLSMNKTEERDFIDLWETMRCLWDPRDPNYKSKSERKAACREIARVMNHPEWTEDQVLRKMKSLRGTYNNAKRKMSSGLGMNSEKRWCHFDRLASFLQTVEYSPSDSMNNTSHEPSEFTEESLGDMVMLQDQEGTFSTCMTLPRHPAPMPLSRPMPRKCLSPPPTPSASDDLTSAIRKMTEIVEDRYARSRQESSSPNAMYGQYLASKLDRIRSTRRLLMLQHKIDSLVHEALLEETTDD